MIATDSSAARGIEPQIVETAVGSSYGLRYQVLTPIEVLGQSIANIAPTGTPAVVIPLVYAAAGKGTGFAYLFAMLAVLLVSLNISQFARRSASPGSIYTYIAMGLGPQWGILAGWTLLIAYIGCAASVTSGFTNYVNVLFRDAFALPDGLSTLALTAIMFLGVAGAWLIAYKDMKLSAQLALLLELVSLLFIIIVVIATLIKHGAHFDYSQFYIADIGSSNLRLGLVLAIFSFTGFESATSLGSEASTPLRTIPRAMIRSSIIVGVLFVLSTYTEIVGFADGSLPLDASDAPLQVLATRAGIGYFGVAITIGAIISFFACILASINSAARILLLMSRHGVFSASFGDVHAINQTPHVAVGIAAVLSFVPAGLLAWLGVRMFDIYGLIGTTATIGFILSYIIVSVAAPIYLHRRGELRPRHVVAQVGAIAFMAIALAGAVYPLPSAPGLYSIYAIIVLVGIGIVWGALLHVCAPSVRGRIQSDLAVIGTRFPHKRD
jgi:amino acid transporter